MKVSKICEGVNKKEDNRKRYGLYSRGEADAEKRIVSFVSSTQHKKSAMLLARQ